MNETELALAVITALGAIIGAAGGLSGLAALRSTRYAARKVDMDALNATIATLQAENTRLVARLDDVEQELDEMRVKFSESHHHAIRLASENRFLREQLNALQEDSSND